MKGLLAFGLLYVSGVAFVAVGIGLTFGMGPALIVPGVACLATALVVLRGLSRA